eukprot:jgi/Chlat1/7420/Chrsp6S07444
MENVATELLPAGSSEPAVRSLRVTIVAEGKSVHAVRATEPNAKPTELQAQVQNEDYDDRRPRYMLEVLPQHELDIILGVLLLAAAVMLAAVIIVSLPSRLHILRDANGMMIHAAAIMSLASIARYQEVLGALVASALNMWCVCPHGIWLLLQQDDCATRLPCVDEESTQTILPMEGGCSGGLCDASHIPRADNGLLCFSYPIGTAIPAIRSLVLAGRDPAQLRPSWRVACAALAIAACEAGLLVYVLHSTRLGQSAAASANGQVQVHKRLSYYFFNMSVVLFSALCTVGSAIALVVVPITDFVRLGIHADFGGHPLPNTLLLTVAIFFIFSQSHVRLPPGKSCLGSHESGVLHGEICVDLCCLPDAHSASLGGWLSGAHTWRLSKNLMSIPSYGFDEPWRQQPQVPKETVTDGGDADEDKINNSNRPCFALTTSFRASVLAYHTPSKMEQLLNLAEVRCSQRMPCTALRMLKECRIQARMCSAPGTDEATLAGVASRPSNASSTGMESIDSVPSMATSTQERIHQGFYRSWKSVAYEILAVVYSESAPDNDAASRNLLVCGHSQGGALAMLCAYDLCSTNCGIEPEHVTVYTFDSRSW